MEKLKDIKDREVYLERLAGPLEEKLRVAKYISADAKNVLDVGCADGAVTIALAKLFPKISFLGVDLDKDFVKKAQKIATREKIANVKFEAVYLRDLLARPQKYDAVSFISVLHEFYTYGEGISSVVKALSDAHELLRPRGRIIIRDMILSEFTKEADLYVASVIKKICVSSQFKKRFLDFEKVYGKVRTLHALNHFLLKHLYGENWDRELKENYVPVTFEQYEQVCLLLGMKTQVKISYLLPYLKNKWQEEFNLTDTELLQFSSTGIMVAEKV